MNGIAELIEFLEANTGPRGSWSIDRDDHRSVYSTVADELADHTDLWEWESEAEKQRACDMNRMVELHWYKSTPVGSYKIAAPDLYSLVRFFFSQEWM